MEQGICSVATCTRRGVARGMCDLHYGRWRKHGDPLTLLKTGVPAIPAVSRFWPKVNKEGPVPENRPDLGPCWLWTAGRRWNEYGSFGLGPGRPSTVAHKFAYELLVGPVPEGLQLDHLCRVRYCVNPSHLEPVPQRVNILRGEAFSAKNAVKTHCPQDHPYIEGNIKWKRAPNGRRSRECLTCHRERERERQRKKKALGEPEVSQ